MSDSHQQDRMTVASDGISVTKRFEEDEFPVPAIAFEIRSERPETVTITLVDEVPEGVAVDDLGFHPEYGSEYWTIEEDRITFEREIEAESEYTTVYGIRATGTDDVAQFLGEPRIEAVDPPLEGGTEIVEEDSSDIVRDLISGDSESVPGLDDEGDPGTSDTETLDLDDPSSSGEGAAAADAGSAILDRSGDAESLVGALAAEIRNGSVDDEDVALLRDTLDVADGASGSTEARIERLQKDVADLLAYTDALEEFLDENGAGADVVEGFREDVESFESELEAVRSLAEGREEAVESLEESVAEVESSLETVRSDVESALGEVREVEERVEAVETEVREVGAEVETVGTEMKAVESEVDEIGAEVDEVGDEMEAVNEELADVGRRIDDLDERVGDIDVGEIEAQLADIESEIEDLKEWREQLSSVMGG